MAGDNVFTFNNGYLTVNIFVLIFGVWCGFKILRNLTKWRENLKKLPSGPTGLPFVGYVPFLGSEPHKELWKLKDKYGDIMSLYLGNKYTIILSEYSIAKEVLSHPAALDRAQEQFDALPCIGFQIENGESWVEQRRFCLSATRDLGLGKGHWDDLIMDELVNFIVDLRENFAGKPVNISKPLAMSVSSSILSLLIGRKLDKNAEEDIISLSLEFTKLAFIYLGPSEPASIIPGLRRLLKYCRIGGYDKAAEVVENFGKFVKREIDRHKTAAEFQNVNDFINSYLKKIEELSEQGNFKHFFSERMLQGNLTILFLGSTDTVLSSLRWLMRLMADYPDMQVKVYTELMEVLGKEGRAKYEERNKIPYTFAVLMEAQRVSSIVPLSTTRKLNSDICVKGITLPKNAEVSVNTWGLHHDARYWKQPNKFLPERFLTDNGSKLIRSPPSYVPFSTGRRNCPGETIAWKGILGYFTEIMKNFEVRFVNGEAARYEITNGLVSHLKPQNLIYIERT